MCPVGTGFGFTVDGAVGGAAGEGGCDPGVAAAGRDTDHVVADGAGRPVEAGSRRHAAPGQGARRASRRGAGRGGRPDQRQPGHGRSARVLGGSGRAGRDPAGPGGSSCCSTWRAAWTPTGWRRPPPQVLAQVAPAQADETLERRLQRQAEAAQRNRSLVFRRDGNGSILFTGSLPLVDGEAWIAQLDAYTESKRRTALEERDPAGTGLTPEQRRADALVAMILHHTQGRRAPKVGGDRPRIVVTVDYSKLLADATGCRADRGRGTAQRRGPAPGVLRRRPAPRRPRRAQHRARCRPGPPAGTAGPARSAGAAGWWVCVPRLPRPPHRMRSPPHHSVVARRRDRPVEPGLVVSPPPRPARTGPLQRPGPVADPDRRRRDPRNHPAPTLRPPPTTVTPRQTPHRPRPRHRPRPTQPTNSPADASGRLARPECGG